jgi:hypothetical protein
MLKFFRDKRFDVKTTLIVLAVIGVFWAVVIYANLGEFIPPEFRNLPRDSTG